ncbi:MAG TPA: LuxR family transcriptional regulator [Hyphomonas sp.]|uniref:TatD family hydrolase n=1 Tax=unclassified Hyphomonas TaxID=2630699 RepID=UPI000E935A5A|nr:MULTISPECIES: TatD family hydrolase [unclassified Hyphomonas]HBL92192.1 LuxR family transcriptional regulator [Hyphomonas sp.]HCJ17500.1 LuxR family transcriptional regulator [Hyphomonas sp.]HCN92481.1 LuxR family transcriptional regulator [Hyphomonas sp.]|tara:strand:- start:5819 stop:6592 length:774 start_codon:yes stop_codon:yes gene_type:complete
MFDTHVNLHGETFADDLGDVLTRADEAGVKRMLAICDRLDNFEAVRSIAQAHPGIWCSIGVHPHHSKDFTDLSVNDLVNGAADPNVVAIGETGLDFHYGYSAEDAQINSLRTHVEAARQTGLPLILHTREADEMMGDILEEEFEKGSFVPLLHCYTGGARLAQRGLDLGGFVSVSGILSFKSAREVREVITDVPMDRLILETDCPYLAPVPMRGRRNEPSYLIHVAEALASLKSIPLDDVLKTTTDNAMRLFSRIPN